MLTQNVPFYSLTPAQIQEHNNISKEISQLKQELYDLMVLDRDLWFDAISSCLLWFIVSFILSLNKSIHIIIV